MAARSLHFGVGVGAGCRPAAGQPPMRGVRLSHKHLCTTSVSLNTFESTHVDTASRTAVPCWVLEMCSAR